MVKERFATYINDMLIKHNMSEAKLAKELNISQKSINRYRNAITCPNIEIQRQIINYFETQENRDSQEKVDDGQGIIGFYVDGTPIFEQNEYDEDDIFNNQAISEGSEQLKFFTPKAQEFIVNNYYLIGAMTYDEFEFINKMHQCNDNLLKQIVGYMQELKDDLRMYICEELDPEYYGIQSPSEDYFWKTRGYLNIVYNIKKYPTTWNIRTDSETGKQGSRYIKKTTGMFQSLNFEAYAAGMDISGNMVIENSRRISEYWQNEWYYLYLYARTKLYDTTCETVSKIEYGGREVGWNELKLWKLLDSYKE